VIELRRKLFHLLGIFYALGFFVIPHLQYLCLLGFLLIVEFSVEYLRLRNTHVRLWFESWFGSLFRDSERTNISGVFWMVLGVFVAAFLAPFPNMAAAATLYLILGDAAASLVGQKFGGPKWPKSKKTLVGSLACFVVCVVVGWFLLTPYFGWPVVLIGALFATLFEVGLVPINDNFLIPAGSSLVFLLLILLS